MSDPKAAFDGLAKAEGSISPTDLFNLQRGSRISLFRLLLTDFSLPAAIYLVCFFLLTYPIALQFCSSFYCDQGDGLQNEWNLWWIRKAILQLHQSPWHTNWLHAPQGTTLIGHTLNPLNGLIGIPLSYFFTRVEVYNLIVSGSFVASGLTAFWLARHVVRSYIPAIFSGFAFTFTGYHFAHAYGHMQLISMEFIPLFLVGWLMFLERPTVGRALFAAAALALVEFCDFYYLLYCVLIGAICVPFYGKQLKNIVRDHPAARNDLILRVLLFASAAALFCGPLMMALLVSEQRDPLGGAHADIAYSADLFAAFVPGEVNLLGRFTPAYWSRLNHNLTDESVYLGLSVIALAVYGVVRSASLTARVGLWVCLAVVSFVLSLGPALHACGVGLTGRVLPYAWLETLLPPMQLSGIPARFSVILALACSILAGFGVAALCRRGGKRSGLLAAGLAIVMAIDLCPASLPTTPAVVPAWTAALRNLPLKGAVISRVADRTVELYYQTLYDRPMAFGYISRVPWSVYVNDQRILADIRLHDYAAMRALGFVYVILPRHQILPGLPIVYRDADVNIQQLPG